MEKKKKPAKFVLAKPLKSPVGLRHRIIETHTFRGKAGREFKLWPGTHKEYWWQWESVESRPNAALYKLLSDEDTSPVLPKSTRKVAMLYVTT